MGEIKFNSGNCPEISQEDAEPGTSKITGTPNGIACPTCGTELIDLPVLLLTYPPQRATWCLTCKTRSSRWT